MDEPRGLLLANDLMWTSRITGTALALGFRVRAVGRLADLIDAAKQSAPRVVILDLEQIRGQVAEVIQQVEAVLHARPRFVAYGSHVEVGVLTAAREAGCDPALPRSKMAEDLPRLLGEWFTGDQSSS